MNEAHGTEPGKLTLRRRTWQIVELTRPNSTVSRVFNIAMLVLIFLNVVAVIVGSVAAIESRFGWFLEAFEVVSVLIFSVEYQPARKPQPGVPA